MGAMSGYGTAFLTGSPWLGVAVAGAAGMLLGILHAWACSRPRVNDIAVGIALMLFGTGLAFFLGKPFVEPKAPNLPSIALGWWSDVPQIQAALKVNAFCDRHHSRPDSGLGVAQYALGNDRAHGRRQRGCGSRAGFPINRVRMVCTAIGGFLAGVGGSFLSLYYPGSWNEGLSSGQGLMAVALVIFARWKPVWCLYASLLFGGAGAIGPALQSVGITSGYYLFNAAPYILTLVIMIITCSPRKTVAGAPLELSVSK